MKMGYFTCKIVMQIEIYTLEMNDTAVAVIYIK